MATKWTSPVWRMPENSNQSKLDNYSLDFNGSDHIALDTSSISLANSFSISMWIKPSSVTGFQMLFGGSGYSGGTGIGHYIYNDTIWTYISSSGTAVAVFQSSSLLNINEWTHIIIQRNVGVNWQMWVNGVLKETNSSTQLSLDLTSANSMIARHYNGSLNFNGKISQTAIFDYALSETQVKYLYNNNAGGSTPNPQNPMAIAGPTPIAYYPLGQSATGDDNTLTTPNESSNGDTVFDFLAAPTYSRISLGTTSFTGNKTISFWLNKGSNNGTVLGFGNTNYYPNVQSTTLQLNNGTPTVLSTGTINLNEWNHYVITGDGTTAKCYVNGVYKSTGTDRDISSGATWIGGQNNGTGMLLGKLSNVQKWEAVLTDGGVSIGQTAGGEVATIYNGGRPYTGTQPQAANLKAWYKMNVDTSEWNGSNWLLSDSSITPTYTTAINFPNTFQNPPALWPGFTRSDASWSGTNITLSFWVRYPNGYDGSVNYIRASGINIGGIGSAVLQFGSGSTYRNFSVGDLYDKGWHNVIVYIPNSSPTFLISNVRCWIDGSEVAGSNIGSGTASQITTISGWGLNAATSNLSNWTLFNSDLTGSISTLYNGGTPADVNSLNPVSWYKCDSSNVTFPSSGGTSITFIDSSSSSNNATGPYDGNGDVERPSITSTNVQAGNGTSSGMTTANLVTSDLNRSLLYSSYSMDFDGTDHIDTNSAVFSGVSSFTASAWITFDTSLNLPPIFSQEGSASEIIILLRYHNTLQKFQLYSETTNGLSIAQQPNNSFTPVVGKWYNIAAVYDGSNLKIYLDTVEIATQAQTGTLVTGTDTFKIGKYSSNYFNGKMSNVSVFNKALSENDILTIYNGGAPNNISSLSPVGWWSLSGDSYFASNWICPDLSANSNNGTSSNLPVTALVGNAPGSTANGTGTNMAISNDLQGDAPNSDKNAISVNMVATNRVSGSGNVP